MKYQDLFSLKNKKKNHKKLSSATVVTGALRINDLTLLRYRRDVFNYLSFGKVDYLSFLHL